MTDMINTIIERKSVRTYDGKGLKEEDFNKLEDYAKDIESPFGIRSEFRFLEADKFGLKSPVLSGVKLYVAGKVEAVPYADVSFGYSFEKLVLLAQSMGIGTVWIAGTMNRDAFEKAMDLKENEIMPCISPLGYPGKRSMKETLMRKGVKADSRLDPSKLFFSDNFENQDLSGVSSDMRVCLEAVRWAPSAVNKQPWRVVLDGDNIHFYEHHDKGYIHPNGMDLQKVDLGIAICHMDLALDEKGIAHEILIDDPGISTPEDTEYIASFMLKPYIEKQEPESDSR